MMTPKVKKNVATAKETAALTTVSRMAWSTGSWASESISVGLMTMRPYCRKTLRGVAPISMLGIRWRAAVSVISMVSIVRSLR